MNLTHEQTNLIITALQNMRAELYINNNLSEMNKVSSVIQNIETEMESKDLSQKKVLLAEVDYKGARFKLTDSNENDDIGSETGIERDYALQNKPNCEVCDD